VAIYLADSNTKSDEMCIDLEILAEAAQRVAHNHPTGDPSPSRDDIALTREVRNALKAVGVSLHDHVIIGRKGHVSLRSMNVIEGWK